MKLEPGIPAAEHDGSTHRDPVDVITPEWIAELSVDLNRCDDAHQAIVRAIGSATMCWERVDRAGNFRSQRALVIAEVLNAHLRGRRALSADLPPAEAGSGNGAGEAREAVSGRPGASQGPSEGEGSAR